MEFLKDIGGFLKVRKNYWLVPALLTLLVVGILVAFSGTAAVPMIYTLF